MLMLILVVLKDVGIGVAGYFLGAISYMLYYEYLGK